MTKLKVIYAMGNPIFFYKEAKNKIGYSYNETLDKTLNGYTYCFEMDLLLDYLQHTTKTDILLAFEYVFLKIVDNEFFTRHELDSNIVQKYYSDTLGNDFYPNTPNPTYISEYINVIGQLFLAGYIDFGSYCDNDDKERIDYPTNLSYYKEDKYQAWIHFRDNFFYTGAYNKGYDEDIMIYEGKEYSVQDCPRYINKDGDSVLCGHSTMFSDTSWDTPKYWSQYNIWVARTPKGDEYFKKVLAPRFYNKYKDLEVEIDDKGNVIRWIGQINR
ncbi:hypothetical protein [Campylobacter coli]|uniref:hypothetical protein n=1 Tax=Campylobacter coli TaxID=195 RepID=UPI000717343F|nr:hypothetical protein [Campylobacter coli]KRS47297.1 hypothetical protein DB18_07990 [Campylobacter coli]HAA1931896.1 hypothetical protein [Campylobacter coli]HEF9389287.1 hypothetical protein [Campylobacter coli]HEF9402770.1 hypothetical protein [Campylobacter coli]